MGQPRHGGRLMSTKLGKVVSEYYEPEFGDFTVFFGLENNFRLLSS